MEEAIKSGADRIMLDNMDIPMMKKAVSLIKGKAESEASGGITREMLKEVASTGVDFISAGALTHSAENIDLSLKAVK
ncbi:Nicotinate-nucleotide pyrophosphorylase [carboxylating] [bioreactor metagenome]|uniref:Nicotinate-nucleotide pyrophosphorylase [carboxylating] n=1 Tax=bioreactor metagenome TaxID=1076179 RepID=A0A645GTR7_9ZZZZ